MRTVAGAVTRASIAGLLVVALGCGPAGDAQPSATAVAHASGAPSSSAATAPTGKPAPADPRAHSDDLKPVFPITKAPPNPLAQRFCQALYGIPDKRMAACCTTSLPGAAHFAAECTRTLSFDLDRHAVSVAETAVDACVAALEKATEGCDWVTAQSVATPAACLHIIVGTTAEKAACKSSLECAPGLRCHGVSAIDDGRCGPPRASGAGCNAAIDTLASVTRQSDFEVDHPQCSGSCRSHRCVDEKNAAPKARPAPLAEGAACDQDDQCRGRCVRGDGGAAGKCEKSCPSYLVPRIPVTHASASPLAGQGKRPPGR